MTKVHAEKASCLGCDGRDLTRIRPYRTNSVRGREVFEGMELYQCANCGLVQSIPRPSQESLAEYYREDYRVKGYAGSDVADVQKFPYDNLYYCNRAESITDLLKNYISIQSPRILDIGAGYGHILHFLGKQFPNSRRSAIEFSAQCVAHLKTLGVDVSSRPVEEVLVETKNQFDVVTLSHVLEHLLDPSPVLQLIRSSLVQNGLLYIEVPNIPADALLRFPDHMWAPRYDEPHITFFSEHTLTGLVQSNGFTLEFCSTAGPFYRYISAFRYRLPPFRETVVKYLPEGLFRFLRKQSFTSSVRVQQREESFFQYGGERLWLRSVWRRKS